MRSCQAHQGSAQAVLTVKDLKRSFPKVMLLPLLIGGAGMVWYQNHDRHRAEGYLAARAEPGDIEDTVSALGTLQPVQYVDVGTQVTGQLKTFLDKICVSAPPEHRVRLRGAT